MRVLLDTHVWLWMAAEPERLSAPARDVVEALEHDLFMSAASAWEIAIKHRLGRLRLPDPPATYVPSRLEMMHVRPLAIEHEHALRVALLPEHHRDPFDRLLVAQAQLEDLTIITADEALMSYDVATIRA